MMAAKRVNNPRTRLIPMPIWPSGTRTLITFIAAELSARASQMPWVGLNTVPSAISPETNGQPSVPAVANFRNPPASNASGASSFSSPAHRKMMPTMIRSSATPPW